MQRCGGRSRGCLLCPVGAQWDCSKQRDSITVSQSCITVHGCTHMLQDPICLIGQNCRCKTHWPNIHRSNVFSMQEACSWGEDVRGDAESHSANVRPDRLSLHSEGKDPRNTESKSHSYCLLAAIKLLSNACATVSLYATHRFCFCRRNQASKSQPCQKVVGKLRRVLWSGLISPCWCSVVIAALFLSVLALHFTCRFTGFFEYY